jgi:predicted flavoprotein YhiN
MTMSYDTLILGAGAAGLFCAAQTGRRTLIIDHAKAPGEKIRISGGGRCNFTNLHTGPENFLSGNPHFCKSALARYTQWDFIDLVDRHGIAWHEKTLGQLFCDGKSTQIVSMLVEEARGAGADLWLSTRLIDLSHDSTRFHVVVEREGSQIAVTARNLVLATGGKSIPKMGATGLAYDIARQFGHDVTKTRPALVPFTFSDAPFADLAGTALPVRATCGGGSFDEAALFDTLHHQRRSHGRRNLTTELGRHLPAKLVTHLAHGRDLTGNLADHSDASLSQTIETLRGWTLKPTGTEGYRTAEVTLGGIDTAGLSSKTMGSHHLPGLYAIGEAVDVTGWLGGYNFQWAWSSGWAAGQAIAATG